MKVKISILFVALLISLASCRQEVQERTYNFYSFYRLYRNDTCPKNISTLKSIQRRIDKSTSLWTISYDSIYFPRIDEKKLFKHNFEISTRIDQSNLSKSKIEIKGTDTQENYSLTLLKKQRINNKTYNIYRFDHDWQGEDGRYAIFYTTEFGIILQFDYDKGGLTKLEEITDFRNKDFKLINHEILDDSIFLFTPKEKLKQAMQ